MDRIWRHIDETVAVRRQGVVHYLQELSGKLTTIDGKSQHVTKCYTRPRTSTDYL